MSDALLESARFGKDEPMATGSLAQICFKGKGTRDGLGREAES